jgi:HrpA-like RNA helicase
VPFLSLTYCALFADVLRCAAHQALGIDNIMRFDWLAPPPAEAAVRGLELLHALGALDGDAK